MSLLEKIIKKVFNYNLGLKKGEKVLIVVDKNKRKIGRLFLKVGRDIVGKIDFVEIPIGNVHGTEPPSYVARKMLNYDVELLITTKSLTHTKARKNACKNGARVVTLPNITEDMMRRTFNVDYKKVHERNKKICDVLDKGKRVKIISKNGTELTLNVKGRNGYGRKSGVFLKKGDFGNLPCGEAFIAPVERSANGVFVIDGSIGGIGKVDMPVTVFVEDGYVKNMNGGKSAKTFLRLINKVGKKARNIAELGIGTNDKAKITGNMLEDEKVMGTCHIALGDNSGFGGRVTVPFHVDSLIKNPTIFVDGKMIMKKGKLFV